MSVYNLKDVQIKSKDHRDINRMEQSLAGILK